MKGHSIIEKFDEAEELFSTEEDQETLKTNRKAFTDSQDLIGLVQSPGGRLLIKTLKEEISIAIQNLITTREGKYVSDIDSRLTLLTKLTGASKQSESIGQWLDSLD